MSGPEDGAWRSALAERLTYADVVLLLVPLCLVGGIVTVGIVASLSVAFGAASLGAAAAVAHALFANPPRDANEGGGDVQSAD